MHWPHMCNGRQELAAPLGREGRGKGARKGGGVLRTQMVGQSVGGGKRYTAKLNTNAWREGLCRCCCHTTDYDRMKTY